MSRATIAVTGGTGFVGRTLLRHAVEEGYEVRALARSPQPEQPGVTWIEGTLDRPETLRALATGADAVIHVAGVVNAPDAAGFEAGNVGGTLAMVEAARAAGVERFVHVSSLSAREPQLSAYGASKAKAETVLQASGLDWTIVRPPWIYGPGDADSLDMFRMARNGFVLLPPDGRISVIEVSDLARLLLVLLPSGETRAKLYEVDDGKEGAWSHKSFGKAIGWAVGHNVTAFSVPAPLLRVAAGFDRLFRGKGAKLTPDRVGYFCHPDWTVDPAKRPPPHLWLPQVGTRDGLKATAAAYRAAGWLRT